MESSYFYERQIPEVGELVTARIESINDIGISCRLLEYNNMEALLLMSEVSKKRVRSIRKIIAVGNVKILQVLRTNASYVDLSKKHVNREMTDEGTDKYEKGKHLISIIRQLADVSSQPFDLLCSKILWPLYSLHEKGGDHPYHILKNFTFEDMGVPDVPEELREPLKKIIRQRIVLKEIKVGATIEMTCYSPEGIDAIKEAAKLALADFPGVKLQYVSAPTYQVWMTGTDEDQLVSLLEDMIDLLSKELMKRGGECQIITAPSMFGESNKE